ncbi:MAG: CZB domain-containing protein [Lysobacter sp.]|nr:CZB domain-containing protein [Lysobacter sp.]
MEKHYRQTTTDIQARRAMGLFDFLKSFGSKKEQEKAREDVNQALTALDLDVAIGAHRNWKDRLTNYLEGHSSEDLRPEVICHDDRCDLGKWIYSDGQKQLGQYPMFIELRAVHKIFHQQASSVVALHQSGKIDAAKWLLDGEYTKTSNRIVTRLEDLKMMNSSIGE